MNRLSPVFFSLLLLSTFQISAQVLSGKISDESGNPIPYATVYVKEIRFGTTSNDIGNYELKLREGTYSILFQSLGFESAERRVEIHPGTTTLNISLKIKSYQLQGVKITPGSEDPAYAIMRKAIGFAPYYQNQISKFNAEVYLKGTFKFKKIAWYVKRMAKSEGEADELPKEGALYLTESVNEVRFTAPDKYEQTVKIIQSNFPDNGGDDPMQFINASLYQPKIGEIILPLSPYAFNHYKFRYEGFNMEGKRVVNKIMVIPRRKSQQLMEGFIYIADDYWNLHAAELSVETIFGLIKIHQNFSEVEKNVWLPVSHFFEIFGKIMGNEFDVNYTASVKYKDIALNTNVKPPIKLNDIQVAKTEEVKEEVQTLTKNKTKEEKRSEKIEELLQKDELSNRDMYKLSKLMREDVKEKDTAQNKSLELKDNYSRIKIDSLARKGDSALWQSIRPVALTPEELDGVKKMATTVEKKDSVKTQPDSVNQKPSIINDILFGESWQIDSISYISFSGLLSPSRVRFNTVDGFVYGIGFRYRKKSFFIRPVIDYAFNRKTLMGLVESGFEYAPLKRGEFSLIVGSSSTDFNRINGVNVLGNSVASLFFKTNYMMLYEHQFVEAENKIDLANGLRLKTSINYDNRTMLENNTDYSFYAKENRYYKPNIPLNDTAFGSYTPNHQSTVVKISLSYTPRYYYRMIHSKKYMVDSRYPTFFIGSTFALPGIAKSDADFVELSGGIKHSIRIEPSNDFSYRVEAGTFILHDKLYFTDYKHFNTQEIPVVLSGLSESFQLLPYYEYSSGSNWATGFVNYQSSYIALKYLPFLSKRFWKENIHASWLYSDGNKPYYEVGYSLDQIGLFGGVGFFAGFRGKEFYGFGIKASIQLRNEITL